MEIGEKKKLQIKVGDNIYIYRGKILDVSNGVCTLEDVKSGIIKIKISEIVIEEPYFENGDWK